MAQNETVTGTDEIKDPVPDAEIPKDDPSRYDYGSFGDEPPPPEKKEEEPTPSADNEPVKEPVIAPSGEPVKDKPPTDEAPKFVPETVPEPVIDDKVKVLDAENKALKAEIETIKNKNAALEEFEKNPMGLILKHLPQLGDRIDPNRFISDKLAQEFGKDFLYDAGDAYREGTQSYKFRLRDAELRDQIQKESAKAQAMRTLADERTQQALAQSKDKVIKSYGLTEQQFDKEVVQWAKNYTVTYEDMAKIRFFDKHIEIAVAKALKSKQMSPEKNELPNPASVPGLSESKVPEHLQDLQDEFGDL